MEKIEKKGKKWKLADVIESSRRQKEGNFYATWRGPCQMMAPTERGFRFLKEGATCS